MFSNCGRWSGFSHLRRRLVNIPRRFDALGVVQVAEHDENHSREALQVAGEHPGAATDISRKDLIYGKVDAADRAPVLVYKS